MNDAPKPEPLSRNVLLALLAVCLIGVGSVVFLVLRPGAESTETVISLIESPDAEEAGVNVLQVTDAIEDADVVAEEGRRYKVLVVDEAKEGASGITRIGGLVTFVPNARIGDVMVIEVTRVKRTTADAIVIERLETGRPVPAPARPERLAAPERPRSDRRGESDSEMIGKTYRATITDTGREGDGVAHLDGKVVFVKGAQQGEYVEFVITEDAGRFARAEVKARLPTPEAKPAARTEAKPRREPTRETTQPPTVEHTDQPVDVGQEHEVTITEPDRRHPDLNGVARVENFVIFVPGTKVGDRVRIRITELRARSAMSEVLERLEAPPTEP